MTFTFESVDISPFRPPPPAPIDAETTEREVLEHLRKGFYGGWISRDRVTGEEERRPLIHGVEIDDVRLERSFPDTHVVVTFTSSERPGVGFARARPIWQADGELGLAECMDINLMEDIEACGYGLPLNPIVGDDGLSWF